MATKRPDQFAAPPRFPSPRQTLNPKPFSRPARPTVTLTTLFPQPLPTARATPNPKMGALATLTKWIPEDDLLLKNAVEVTKLDRAFLCSFHFILIQILGTLHLIKNFLTGVVLSIFYVS